MAENKNNLELGLHAKYEYIGEGESKVAANVPNNFVDSNKISSKYLDLAGLTAFWTKAKDYVDTQDRALYAQVGLDMAAQDAAVRDYIQTLTVNNVPLAEDGIDEALKITIDGTNIKVAGTADTGDDNFNNTSYSEYTVAAAIADVDKRLDKVQTELAEGVVSGLIVEPIHQDTDEWVKVNAVNGGTADKFAVGNIKVTIDDSAIDEKFESIDEEIAFLEANAGVTNIAVKDVDGEGYTNKGLVEISLQATKASTIGQTAKPENWEGSDADWTAYQESFGEKSRGDILITLNESGLDKKLDEVDTRISLEVTNRKADAVSLAGTGFTHADGDVAGSWNADVNYTNITDISEYLDKNEANLAALADEDGKLKVNGHDLITVTAGDQVTVAGKSITLTGVDIARNAETNAESIADVLAKHDQQFAALVKATDFVGVVDFNPTTAEIKQSDADAAGLPKYVVTGDTVADRYFQNGDIVIYDSREFILDVNAKDAQNATKPAFIELGDTTAEEARLSALEAWVDGNYISEKDIEDLDWTKPTFGA